MAFNPQDYMIKLGNKDYLPVAYRIVWFKDKHGDSGAIATEVLNFEPLLVKATILINGVIVSTGHGSAKASAKAVWTGREIEKAETAAIGRALGHAGFGTQFDEDEDLEHLADSPVEKKPTSNTDEYAKFVCNKLVVKLAQRGRNQGKPFYVYPNVQQPNQYATDFSRDRLRQAGYNVDTWDKVGEYPLNPPALVVAKMDGDYLYVTEIAQDTPL